MADLWNRSPKWSHFCSEGRPGGTLEVEKAQWRFWGGTGEMTRPFLEPFGRPGRPIGGPFWELLWTIFVTDFRPLFGEPFWLFWGGPDEQKHTNS